MEFGLQARGDWDYVLTAARWAEKRGLAAIALPDHYLQRGDEKDKPAWDHLVHLAGLARETENIGLVSLVSPIGFRHPAVLYKMGVTLDEISGGRFTLGVGAGWLEEEFTVYGLDFPEVAVRMEQLEEAVAYLRAAITPGAVGFEGEHYRLEEFDPHPRPANLRLISGGEGKAKARSIIVRYLDEYNLYARKPEQYREVVEKTRAEAAKTGRDPDEIFWSSAGPGIAAKKESDYRRLLDKLFSLTGVSPEDIETRYEERGYPHGSGSKAAEMIAAIEEAGCQRFYPQLFVVEDDPSDFEIILDAYQG